MQNATMWRVRYAEGNASGTGSGGDVAYYEPHDFHHMEADLLDALLNADCGDGGNYGRANRLSRILRRHQKPEVDAESNKWRRYRVVEVAYLSGGKWVPVTPTWTPPKVVLTEEAS